MDHENEDRPPVTEKGDYKPWGLDENAFCLLLHLSRLPGYGVAPRVIGLIGNLISARSFTGKVTENTEPTGTETDGETLRFPAGFAAAHFSFATPCGAWRATKLATFEVALSSWLSVTCKSCFRATCWLLPIHWQTTCVGKCSSNSLADFATAWASDESTGGDLRDTR